MRGALPGVEAVHGRNGAARVLALLSDERHDAVALAGCRNLSDAAGLQSARLP